MAIPLMRYQRNKIMSDKQSPVLTYLKRVPGQARTITDKEIAQEIEALGAMSAEDVIHVLNAFVRSLRKTLTRGDKVKIPMLGTFYTTFNCEGTADEKDCTVKNIRKVNVRFAVDNTLRLVNDSNASTRGAANNMEYYINSDANSSGKPSQPGDEGNSGNNGDGDDDYTDPDA